MLSNPITLAPFSNKDFERKNPTKPAPPVTKYVLFISNVFRFSSLFQPYCLISKKKNFKKDSVSVNLKKTKTSDEFDFIWSGTCFLKMRPYKKSGGKKRYGMWSNVKKVKVK